MRKRIDDEKIKKIVELYQEGHSIYEIAEIVNVSPTTAHKYVQSVERRKATKGEIQKLINEAKKIGIPEEDVKRIIPDFEKRQIVQFALNLMRLRPFFEKLEGVKNERKTAN